MRTTTAPPIAPRFDCPTIRAAALVEGRHAIRPPGELEYLEVTGTDRTLATFVIRAGGREFTTSPTTPWPAIELEVAS